MKLSLLVAFFITFLGTNSEAQNINTNPFWKGEIRLNNGTIKKGFVQVPNVPGIRAVSYRTSKNSKNERIRKRDIESILVFSESGKPSLFESVEIVNTIKGNASLGKALLLVSHKNNYVTFYINLGAYRVNKEGELYMMYRYNIRNDFPTLSYFIKKRDFEKARLFHETNLVRGLKKAANAYLTEDQELLERINNNELKFSDMNEIIEIYMETVKNL